MIPVRNIYYMLSYAFQILKEQGYKNIDTEHFENTADLFSVILLKSVSLQLKRGLNQEYVTQSEPLSVLKGKIDVSESIKSRVLLKKQLYCSYDEFSINSQFNQIIKSTFLLLLKTDIPKNRKKDIKKLLLFFSDVDMLDIYNIDWNIRYNRNNQTYRLILSICHLAIKGLLHSNADGKNKLMTFLDEQRMCRLYEKFILEYYKKEYPKLTVRASQIPWQLDDGIGTMLPVMQSDIMLSYNEKVLILDAKYYAHTMQVQYDVRTLHSANLYQIFTYVKNKEHQLKDAAHEVSGMLLYAKTDESVLPNNTYRMSGNKISVKTLDLNCDFSEIQSQLHNIVVEHFGEEVR